MIVQIFCFSSAEFRARLTRNFLVDPLSELAEFAPSLTSSSFSLPQACIALDKEWTMARFYKGVGVGTYLHGTDLRLTGILARSPASAPTINALMAHIAHGTTTSPFISLTRSFGVAKDYAINASRKKPTSSQPAHVYEIDIDDTHNVTALDPIFEVSRSHNGLFSNLSFHHNGGQSFILGVVDPIGNRHLLSVPPPQPRTMSGSSAVAPRLTPELESLVRALRDAEVLIVNILPRACVLNRYDEF